MGIAFVVYVTKEFMGVCKCLLAKFCALFGI